MKKRIMCLVIVLTIMASSISAYGDTGMNGVQDALKGLGKLMVSFVSYAAERFKDVKESDWFAEYVGKLNSLMIIDGMPDGTFNPKGTVTRAQFVKMLVQAMGYKKVDSISFDDIKPLEHGRAHWASVYVETALRNGVISLDELGGKFFPEAPITRKDMFMMMYKALQLQPSAGENPFFDTESNGVFTKLFEEYLARGVLDGEKRLFRPGSHSTRAEAAVVIARMLEYKADPSGFVAKMEKQERISMPLDMYERLMSDPKNLDGRTMEQANEDLYEYTEKSVYLKYYNYTPEQLVEHVVKLARDYIAADWNIDYRTVEKTYPNKVKDIIPAAHYRQDVPRIIKYYIDNKVIQETTFYTNTDLVYGDQGLFYVRGTVIFRYLPPTSQNALSRLKERDNGKLLALGQWYSEDIELRVAGTAEPNNPNLKLTVGRVNILNQPLSVER